MVKRCGSWKAELDAVVGEHGVDAVRHGGDEGFEEGGGCDAGRALDQLDEGELADAVDGDKELEPRARFMDRIRGSTILFAKQIFASG